MLANAAFVPWLAIVAAAVAANAVAQSGPPPIAPELRARFGFVGPLATKVGDGLGNLQVADIDGDGIVEAVAIDARRARLVAIKAIGGKTELVPIPTGGQIAGYAIADVHGDGKPDLLIVDGRGRLTVRHPGKEPGTPLDLGLGGRNVGLIPGDLDGDGKKDIVAISRGQLRWLTRVGDTPQMSPIEAIEENTASLHVFDVDGDKHLDLVTLVSNTNMNLRLRRGSGDGTFGPWRILQVDDLRELFLAKTADGRPALGCIAGPTRRVGLLQWQDKAETPSLDWWAFGENTANKSLPWALTDIDQDGDQDLLLCRPDRAQLLVHEWRDGGFAVRNVPTLAGVNSLSAGDVDGDGKVDLVFVSPEEDAVSWRPASAPLEQFPAQLPAVDKPLAAAVLPTGGVLVLGRTEKRDGHLHRLVPGQEPTKVADLGRLPADPGRLWVADLGDADGLEVAFVVPGEGLRTLTLGAEAKKSGKATETAGFTKKLDDGSVAICEVDGKPALLAVRERFVRSFRLDGMGQVRVLAQDNGPDGLGELSLCADGDGKARYYLDKKANKLVRVVAGKAPLAIEMPALDFTQMLGHQDGVLLLGPRGVLRVRLGGGSELRQVANHEPPTERTFYADGRSGDFDHDGVADLAMVDRQLPGLQILAGGASGLQRALAMPCFEAPPSNEPDNEPRAIETGDFDGDGRADLALIAHDRILIYLQQP